MIAWFAVVFGKCKLYLARTIFTVSVLFNCKHHSKSCYYKYINTRLCTNHMQYHINRVLQSTAPILSMPFGNSGIKIPQTKLIDAVQACMLCMPLPFIMLSTNKTRLVTAVVHLNHGSMLTAHWVMDYNNMSCSSQFRATSFEV